MKDFSKEGRSPRKRDQVRDCAQAGAQAGEQVQDGAQMGVRAGAQSQPRAQAQSQSQPRSQTQAQQNIPYRMGYIPALDGLRTLAVLAVIGYHLSLKWMVGGLLGVTVFFVLSGYLITSLLIQELQESDTINLPNFWLRRVRRLFPAIVLVVCMTAILCGIFNHGLLTKMKPDIVPSLFFFNNWWQIFHDVSYFEAMGAPSPLAHCWSLAIEEQFYLVWPVLLLVAHKVGANRKTVRIITLVLIVISVLLMAILYVPGEDPSRVYYGTDTRAFSLLIGAFLAFMWPAAQLRSSKKARALGTRTILIMDAVGVVALVGLILMFIFADGMSPLLYRGGILLCSCLTAVVIAVTVHPASKLGRAIGCAPMVWVGKRSYGIYLWHYPLILLFMPIFPGHTEPWWFMLIEVAVIVGVSALSYRFVENPIRKGAIGKAVKQIRAQGLRALRRMQGANAGAGESASTSASTSASPARPSVASLSGRSGRSPARLFAEGSARLSRRRLILPPFAFSLAVALVLVGGAGLAIAITPDDAQDENTKRLIEMQEKAESEARQAEIEAAIARTQARIANLHGPSSEWQLLIIGDSVALGASDAILERFPECIVDAAVSRPASETVGIYESYVGDGWQGTGVVLATGTNGPLYDDLLDEMCDAVDSGIPLFLVTERAPHVDWQDENNELIYSYAASRENTYVIDWFSYSNDSPSYFYDDDTHLNDEGSAAYADCLENGIRAYFPAEEQEAA